MKTTIQARSYFLGISLTAAIFYAEQGEAFGFIVSFIVAVVALATLNYGLPSERFDEESEASVEEVELEVIGSK